MTPDERARRAADAMWADDHASRWVGMELVSVGEGRARLELVDEHGLENYFRNIKMPN